MEVAAEAGAFTLAFPCISTGIYGYPAELAAPVAVTTVRSSAQAFAVFREVIFCCFSEADLAIYRRLLGAPAA